MLWADGTVVVHHVLRTLSFTCQKTVPSSRIFTLSLVRTSTLKNLAAQANHEHAFRQLSSKVKQHLLSSQIDHGNRGLRNRILQHTQISPPWPIARSLQHCTRPSHQAQGSIQQICTVEISRSTAQQANGFVKTLTDTSGARLKQQTHDDYHSHQDLRVIFQRQS